MITYLRCQNCKAGYEYAGPKLIGNPRLECPRCGKKVRANVFKVLHRGDIQFTPLSNAEKPFVPGEPYPSKTQHEAGGWVRPKLPRNYNLLPKMKEEDKEAFWEHVKTAGPDECWKWKRHFNGAGYGCFYLRGKKFTAARIVYWMATGIDPGQSPVRHTCQNNACVNPAHLFVPQD